MEIAATSQNETTMVTLQENVYIYDCLILVSNITEAVVLADNFKRLVAFDS